MISYFFVLRLDVLALYLNRAFTNVNNLVSRQKAWINGIALFRENWYTFLIGGGPNFLIKEILCSCHQRRIQQLLHIVCILKY